MRTLIADGHVDIVDILSAPRHDDHPGDGGLAAIVLDDPAVLREIDGRIRQDLLTDALVAHERDDPEQPSLLPRPAGERAPLIAGRSEERRVGTECGRTGSSPRSPYH